MFIGIEAVRLSGLTSMPCPECGAHPTSIPRLLAFGGDGLRRDGHCARCGSAGGSEGVYLDPETGESLGRVRAAFFVPDPEEPGTAAKDIASPCAGASAATTAAEDEELAGALTAAKAAIADYLEGKGLRVPRPGRKGKRAAGAA